MSLPDYSNIYISDFSCEDMQKLADKWYDAAKKDLSSNNSQKLYIKTEKAVAYLKNLEGSLYYKKSSECVLISEKIENLCNAIINGFEKHGLNESKFLAHWIAENTRSNGNARVYGAFGNARLYGAFTSLHHLFKTVKSIKTHEAEDNIAIQDKSINQSNLAFVDSASKFYIAAGTKIEIPEQYDVKLPIFSNLRLTDLLAVRTTSEENKNIVNTLLINRLNDDKISLDELEINNYTDLINFFGERCSELLFLNLEIFDRIDKKTRKKVTMDEDSIAIIVHWCPKIHSINFSGDVKVTHELLEILKNLKSVDMIEFKGFNDAKAFEDLINIFPLLKTVTLEDFEEIKDVSILNKCKKISHLCLTDCPNLDPDFELKSGHLQSLEIRNCEIKSIKCPSLIELTLETCSLGSIECPELEKCSMENCVIENSDLLKDCIDLKELALISSHIEDINLESNLNLNKITIKHCPYHEIFFLRYLSSLKSLIIGNCPVTSINVLTYLRSLQTFEISDCENITNIEILIQCPALKELVLNINLRENTLEALEEYSSVIMKLNRRGVKVREL